MKVLLLGAGASKSYGASPTTERMPIARDFLEVCSRLPVSQHPWTMTWAIRGYLQQTRGMTLEQFSSAGEDIEAFHSEVEGAWLRALRDGEGAAACQAHAAYVELVFLFAAAVNSIQNGPPSVSHIHLAEALEADDRVVTFNWDTLMDRALAETHSWSTDWGYDAVPRQIHCGRWRAPSSPGSTLGPRILKLHGSTNWITSYLITGPDGPSLMQASDPGTFYVFERSTEPYATYKGRFVGGFEPFSYGYYPPNIPDDSGRPAQSGMVLVQMSYQVPGMMGSASEEGLVSMPLIIPPVRQKSYELFGDLFGGLWSAAAKALARAEAVAIIGYSFPETDVRSRELICDSLSARSTPPRVTIVDPVPDRALSVLTSVPGLSDKNVRCIRERFEEGFDCRELFS